MKQKQYTFRVPYRCTATCKGVVISTIDAEDVPTKNGKVDQMELVKYYASEAEAWVEAYPNIVESKEWDAQPDYDTQPEEWNYYPEAGFGGGGGVEIGEIEDVSDEFLLKYHVQVAPVKFKSYVPVKKGWVKNHAFYQIAHDNCPTPWTAWIEAQPKDAAFEVVIEVENAVSQEFIYSVIEGLRNGDGLFRTKGEQKEVQRLFKGHIE